MSAPRSEHEPSQANRASLCWSLPAYRVTMQTERLPRLRQLTARWPVAISTSALVLTLGLIFARTPDQHEHVLNTLGLAWPDLVHAPYRLATALFVQTQPGIRPTIGLLLVVVPVAEWRLGSRRTLLTMFGGDWTATLLSLVALRIAAASNSAWAHTALSRRDGGISAATHALLAAVVFSARPSRWRTLGIAVIGAWILQRLVFGHQVFDAQHAIASVVGAVLGWRFRGRPSKPRVIN